MNIMPLTFHMVIYVGPMEQEHMGGERSVTDDTVCQQEHQGK